MVVKLGHLVFPGPHKCRLHYPLSKLAKYLNNAFYENFKAWGIYSGPIKQAARISIYCFFPEIVINSYTQLLIVVLATDLTESHSFLKTF